MVKERLKLLRESKNLTKKQVAESLQIPYTTYLHYEDGSNQLNNEMLVKLALFYEVSTDWILGCETQKNLPPETKWETLKQLINQLNDESLKDLHSYIKFLIWKETHSD